MSNNQLAVAARLFEHIENKNIDGVAQLYADDVEVWHNFSDASQDKATNLKTLAGLCAGVAEIRYDVQERLVLPDGRVLQRHVLCGRVGDGTEVRIPACMLISIADGCIRRIDEYLDTGQANALRAASGRPPVGR